MTLTMMKISIVFLFVALARAQSFQQLTSLIQPQKSFYEIQAIDKNGQRVGNLILRLRDSANVVVVNSELDGLPSNLYFGLFHNYDGDFNGTCDMTSSPLRVTDMDGNARKGVAFGIIYVNSYDHAVTMQDNEQTNVKDLHTMFTDKLVYIYPVPWDSGKPLNEIINNYEAPLPTPVACGLPTYMDNNHPQRPRFPIVDATEAKSDLNEMIENLLAIISINKEQIVIELLTFLNTAMIALLRSA